MIITISIFFIVMLILILVQNKDSENVSEAYKSAENFKAKINTINTISEFHAMEEELMFFEKQLTMAVPIDVKVKIMHELNSILYASIRNK